MLITREFTFDSAHYLTNYYGKCERLHGHTYKLEVTLEGEVQHNGLVIDFVLFKRIVEKYIIHKLDHQLLNDFFENPSSEQIVLWIWDQLKDFKELLRAEFQHLDVISQVQDFLEKPDSVLEYAQNNTLHLYEIRLFETAKTSVTYRGV